MAAQQPDLRVALSAQEDTSYLRVFVSLVEHRSTHLVRIVSLVMKPAMDAQLPALYPVLNALQDLWMFLVFVHLQL